MSEKLKQQKPCQKFYEIWRDGYQVTQTATLDSQAIRKGDLILEYVLNKVEKVEGFQLKQEDF